MSLRHWFSGERKVVSRYYCWRKYKILFSNQILGVARSKNPYNSLNKEISHQYQSMFCKEKVLPMYNFTILMIFYKKKPLHMQRDYFRIRTHDQQVTKAQLYRCTRARPHFNDIL